MIPRVRENERHPIRAGILTEKHDDGSWSWAERIRDDTNTSQELLGGAFGDKEQNRAVALKGQTWNVGDEVILRALHADDRGMIWEIFGGGESSILIVLTGRTYAAPLVGPPYYQYTGTEVIEDENARYSPGDDITIPIYHQNLLLPLPYWTEAGSTDDIPPEYVVRVAKGPHSNCYIITDQPRWEPVAINANPIVDGDFPGVRATFDQVARLVVAVETNIEVINYNALELG